MGTRWRVGPLGRVMGVAALILVTNGIALADPPPTDHTKWFGDFSMRAYEGANQFVGRVVISSDDPQGRSITLVRYARPATAENQPVDSSTTVCWIGRGVRQENRDAYDVTYVLWRDSRGINEALSLLGGSTPPPDSEIVARGTYRWRNAGWWRSIDGRWQTTDGRSGRDYLYHKRVERVPLGGELTSFNEEGWYQVYVPDVGTLTVESTGAVGLFFPDKTHAVEGVTPANTVTYNVPADKLGWYYFHVAGTGQRRVATRFVQNGTIEQTIRPWSIDTWWQVCDQGSRNLYDSRETDASYGDQALTLFDRALNLTGEQSAAFWERGGSYRTSFDFSDGHYIRISSPTERNAEWEWYADLNGNGVIEQANEESRARVMRSLDRDGNGSVSREEAEGAAWGQVFDQYDANHDNVVNDAEISRFFVLRYDTDSNGTLSRDEFVAALRRDFMDRLGEWVARKTDEIMSKDADGNGVLSQTEATADIGAIDFQDSGDADNDKKDFFDRDNILVVLNDNTRQIGNRLEEATENGQAVVKLFRGRNQDEAVGTWPRANVRRIQRGVADGDFDDSYSVGWWGHCNAWSMAAIMFREPREPLTVNGVTLSPSDQKGILTEFGMGETRDAQFLWQDADGMLSAAEYAAGFHTFIRHWIRGQQQGFMADMDIKDPNSSLGFAVWNYPVSGYETTMREHPAYDDPTVVLCETTLRHASYNGGEGAKHFTYVLHFSANGEIRSDAASRTAWTTRKGYGNDAPLGYVRYFIHPFEFTSRGDSGNPVVTMERLRQLFGDRLQLNQVGGGTTPPATTPSPTPPNR